MEVHNNMSVEVHKTGVFGISTIFLCFVIIQKHAGCVEYIWVVNP